MKASSLEKAGGASGQLLFLNEDNTPYVRVYNRVTGTYDDYKLCVDDLTFIIDSDYFSFVTYPDGVKQLEYTSGRQEV